MGFETVYPRKNEPHYSYLNILPYGIWNYLLLVKALYLPSFEHSSLWDLKRYNQFCFGNIRFIWTFFPMGFETCGLQRLFCCAVDLNILPYGIWNKKTTSKSSSLISFEHSSLWDLKQFLSSKVSTTSSIWTFFPMGFETTINFFSHIRVGRHLNILPYGIWNLECKYPY